MDIGHKASISALKSRFIDFEGDEMLQIHRCAHSVGNGLGIWG